MIQRLLIANRGEIACRIIRTARAMGIATVAVYSTVDRRARHVQEADMAMALSGARPSESYLDMTQLLDAARASGADAIHPGYGFLSENPAFARAVAEAGLTLIGPPASAIEAMGDKAAAKALMAQAGVPLVPGYHGTDQSPAAFARAAEQIGFPILLKASAGGGGKGMKIVERAEELTAAIESARREALAAFGDDRLLLEKYLIRPRHVEIQIFADRQGNCVYLHERDCSIQRRHQKVLEEAPAPGLEPPLRQAMGQAAVRAARAIGYVGAGTLEFLLDARGDFYFMEMNTRLQVEHPVTEAITGLDLVEWQLRIARGEPLPLTQQQIPLQGHAIEVRLYAEDPDHDFLPASGQLQLYREPLPGPGQRIDSGVREGDEISPWYDPLLGKLIAWGNDREQARQRLLDLLRRTLVGGIHSNRGFLLRLLQHPAFTAGALDTGFIAQHAAELLPEPTPLPEEFWEQAGRHFLATLPDEPRSDDPASPWARPSGLRLGGPATARLHLQCGDQQRRLYLDPESEPAPSLGAVRRGEVLFVPWQHQIYSVRRHDPLAAAGSHALPEGGLSAPMNGSVVRVLVQPGQQVEAGTALMVLEAMKMEHSVRADRSGTVRQLFFGEGDMVTEGSLLLELEPAGGDSPAAIIE